MSDEMTKAKLLDAMRTARTEWEAVLARVDESRMTLPALHGGWSVKDTIGHVAYYERWVQTWLQDAVRGKVTLGTHRDGLEVDARNALVWNDNRDRTLSDILAESKAVFDRLYQLVKLLPEADLLAPDLYSRYTIPFWGESRPLWRCIEGDSYGHYHEHAENIRRWLDGDNPHAEIEPAETFIASAATNG
ncbi:MAG: ClbS/DfsB family four-helix bundle protein [Chloroflexi bacterium]|nr:ClbS/DfsB family four-helix bundle protein [Chloroflexota bacterium]